MSATVDDMAQRGRPKADDPLSEVIHVRLTKADHELISAAAEDDGRAVGRWVRDVARAEAFRAERRRKRTERADGEE